MSRHYAKLTVIIEDVVLESPTTSLCLFHYLHFFHKKLQVIKTNYPVQQHRLKVDLHHILQTKLYRIMRRLSLEVSQRLEKRVFLPVVVISIESTELFSTFNKRSLGDSLERVFRHLQFLFGFSIFL